MQCPSTFASVTVSSRIRNPTDAGPVTYGRSSNRFVMYVDPAAGSLIIQVLIAGVLAVTTTVKIARESVMRGVRRLLGRKDR